MGVKLTCKAALRYPLDLSPLSDAALWSKDILSTRLIYGVRPVSVGELFDMEPLEGARLHLAGGLSLAIRVGEGLETGVLRVDGPVGAFAGASMRGGELYVYGDAGADALFEMQDGFAYIAGAVHGGACARMRRGVAVLGAFSGDSLAGGMRGGTVLLLSPDGVSVKNPPLLGEGMDRGTLLLPARVPVPEGFERAGRCELSYLNFLRMELSARGVPLDGIELCTPERWRGDAAALGRGELLLYGEAEA